MGCSAQQDSRLQGRARHTAEGDVVGGDDAGLDDGVLLAREGLPEKPHPLDGGGPEADEEEAEEPRGDVERGYDPRREVELHDDDAEHDGEEEAHHEGAHRQLLPPRRHRPVRERLLHGQRRPRRLVLGGPGPVGLPLRLPAATLGSAVPMAQRARLHRLVAGGCGLRRRHLWLADAALF